MNEASSNNSLTLTPHQRIESLNNQAREALGVDSVLAFDLSSQAYNLALKMNDLAGQAAGLLEMGSAEHRLGRLDAALESLLAAAKHFEELGNSTSQLEALTLIGQVYRDLGELDLAMQKYQEALGLSRTLQQPKDEAKVLNGIAGIEYQQGRYEKALEYTSKLLKVYQRLEDQTGEAACRSNIGMLYTQLGDYPKALEHLLEAYSLTHQFVHDARSEGNCLINIGRLYEKLHEPELARDHYQKALAIGRKAGEVQVEVIATINLGTVYHSLSESIAALEMYRAGLLIARDMGYRRGEIAALDGLAQLYSEADQPDKARAAHHSSILIAREIGDRDQEIDTLQSLGKMHLQVNDYDNALLSFQEALNLAIESNRKPAALESHRHLARAFEHLGDYRKALEHAREFHRLEHEIQGEEVELQVKKLAAKFELEQAKNEAVVLRLQNAVAEQARDAAENANRAKSDFLSRMSHELRTPLNAVLGFAQLLTVAKLETKHHQSAERIFRAGEHLLKLVNEVLDIAQVEAGKITMIIEPVSLQSAILETLELVKPLAVDRGIVLHAAIEQPWMVMADRHRLDQVLLNLLSNAIKYNRDQGQVEIYGEASQHNKVRIWVTDTGKGITSEQAKRLFKPFERLGAEHGNIPGAGLGLAIVKQLLEAMGGEIGIESVPGQGARFWFELPLVGTPLGAPHVDKTSTKASSSPLVVAKPNSFVEDQTRSEVVKKIKPKKPVTPSVPPQLEPPARVAPTDLNALKTQPETPAKIVCLEPATGSLRLLEMILSGRDNTTIFHAATTGDVLRLSLQHHPNLILISDQLGNLALSSLLGDLQNNPKTKHVPVAILSATANNEKHFLAAGAWRCIHRPFDVSTILATVSDALGVQDEAIS